jgi:Zinc finger, ZZ type
MSYSCDGCRADITGLHFQCTVRKNFDMCEKCFNTMPQPYPMKTVKSQPYPAAPATAPQVAHPAVHDVHCNGCRSNPVVGKIIYNSVDYSNSNAKIQVQDSDKQITSIIVQSRL